MKTMTAAQMAWNLKKGYAWADEGNGNTTTLSETFWTTDGGYQWDVEAQRYEMVF